MNFRTIIEIEKSQNKISYSTPIFFIGSCFSENIGQKANGVRLPTLINPNGVLYNPASIKSALERIISKQYFEEHELQFYNNLWFSFSHHSSFSNADKQVCLEKINANLDKAHSFLKNANFLVVTFGTARYYRLIETGEIVSNCHKLPSNKFTNTLFEVSEITKLYSVLIEKLLKFNSGIKIIFTVSPIRHWKDGANNNQISKATLLLAIKNITAQIATCQYFPSYEILLDELRDYRFYADDMLHPSEIAINYIWQKFTEIYIETETKEIFHEVEKLRKAMEHRVLQAKNDAYIDFMTKCYQKTIALQSKFPQINLNEEIQFFEKNCFQ